MTDFPILLYTYPFIYLKPKKKCFFSAEPQGTKTSTTPKRFSTGGSFSRKMLVEESARLENKHDMYSNEHSKNLNLR